MYLNVGSELECVHIDILRDALDICFNCVFFSTSLNLSTLYSYSRVLAVIVAWI